MTLKKKEKKSVFQRLRNLILGKEKPNLLTRISVGAGFLIWIYLISWHVLTLLSILLMGSLKQSELVEGAFNRVGSKLYSYPDTINTLTVHTLLQLILFGIILLGLVLIWRKKKIGFLLYVASHVGTIFITIIVMGMEFFTAETSITDLIITGSATLYFGIGALWFYRGKGKNNEEQVAQQA
jgi:hypothetical protein